MRLYPGNKPESAEGWEPVFMFENIDGSNWVLYCRDQENGNGWYTFKLVSDRPVIKKANYWFVYDIIEKKYGCARDLNLLKKTRIELHTGVKKYIEEIYG